MFRSFNYVFADKWVFRNFCFCIGISNMRIYSLYVYEPVSENIIQFSLKRIRVFLKTLFYLTVVGESISNTYNVSY